ncbi:uncharacterized protein N7483_012348 [Penicillium malachiteum]|uniref:uncharacterized protein n=1 Tax=Penicillium malachiteum TaxID=1324776 RepID=UPI0025479A90|nr:uncharacterized protein N7483_012348 [Penicillium malachiteum]KAJ5715167.1 hypothetical protein N7483_012348 [Penicillium malachiteum]
MGTGNDTNGVNSVTFLISSDVHSGTTIGLTGTATTSYAGVGVPTGPVTAATTATTESTSTAAATITDLISSSTSTSSATASPSSGKSSGDLSTGAKAGIGAGVGVAALILIAAFLLWFLKRRRGQGNGQVLSEEQSGTAKEKTVLLDGAEIDPTKGSVWQQPENVYEMRDNQRPFELDASTRHVNTKHAAELHG